MEEQLPPGLVPVTDANLIAQLEQTQTQINNGAGGAKPNALTPEDRDALRNEALEKIRLARTLKSRSRNGWFTTGFGSGIAGSIEGSGAYDLKQDTATLQNAGALQRIMEFARQNGGKNPLTPLSNGDFQALSNSLSNLDTGQSDGQFQKNVDVIEQMYARAYRAAGGSDLEKELGGGQNEQPRQSGMLPGAVISRDGSSNAPDPAALAYVKKAQTLFDRGGTREEFDVLAAQEGWQPYGVDLDAAIKGRDEKGYGAVINPPEGKSTGPSVLGAVAGSPVGAFATGAANALTLGGLDEIVGATGGDAGRAQQAKEAMRADSPIASFLGESAGGALGMAGVSSIPALAGRALVADVGFGAAYGGGENNDNRLSGAAIGATAGAIGNRLADRISRGLRGNASISADRQTGMDTAAAAKRIGVDVLPADVSGATTRRLTSAAAQGPLSAQPIVSASRRAVTQAQGVRDRVAASVGTSLETAAAGEAARDGAQAFIQRTSKRGGELYAKARELSDGVKVPLNNALQVVQRNVAELQEVPGGTDALGVMEGLAGELGGEWSADGIRSMRTTLRDRFIGEGLRGSDLERRVNQVIDAASKDIEDGLAAAGRPGAAQAYKAADRYWRTRLSTIDNALRPIIGKDADRSGEQIIASLEAAAKGNNARLATFVRSLPPEEQGIVRSTIISRLGNSSAGTQNAAGDNFSLAQFLTHWNQLTPGAKRTLFDDESRAALSDLAKVAEGTKAAQRYSNFSNTGGAIFGQSTIPLAAGSLAGLPTVVTGLAAQYATGRLLASPRFARFLARPPKSAAQVRPWIDRLERIAKAEPVIATEALGLQQQLIRAFGESTPARIAAEERGDERSGIGVRGQKKEQRGVSERLQ